MILGSVSPAFAAGQIPSDELAVSTEATAPESQDEVVIEDGGDVNSEQESVDTQEVDEEEIRTETEVEDGIEEETPDEESKPETDSAEEEEEKPETLVGAEGAHVSVGENVTAGFDSETGTITFYSQGGTLSSEWKSMMNLTFLNWDVADYTLEDHKINAITISDDSDVMYLPGSCEGLFEYFNSLQSLDLSKADTSNVTDMSAMFHNCPNLQSLDISGFDTSNVTNMSSMFHECCYLQTLDVSGFDTSNVTNMSDMFVGCYNLQTLDVSGFDTSNVTDMSGMFLYCSSLQTLDVSGFDTSNVNNMYSMFYNCNSLRTLNVSGFDTSNVTNMSQMFSGCSALQALDVSGFITSNVTDMSQMFKYCNSLQTLDVNGFNTSNVTDMFGMFYDCINLQSLDASGFDTSNVTGMGGMFSGCSSLQSLDVSGFDTSNVTDIGGMFSGCSSLQSLDVSGFDTSNVTGSMGGMFSGCSSLQTLDVSGFNTSNVDSMYHMFHGCDSLQRLDLSSFDMGRVSYADNMLPGFNTSQLLVIMTPVNVQINIYLPDTFVADTAVYFSLPQGLSESIRLTKQGANIPDDPINLADATITGIKNKTYTGTARTQNPTVKLGDKTLTAGTDYTLSYSNNTNAGTATVTITGIGNYTGTISKTFTINKATPTLTFASTSITKTTQDAAFTNTLTKKTDGSVTFKSINTSVATVNSTSGKVTIKGAGTTTITATAAAGTNYKAGSAQYTLTVTPVLNIVNISDDYYGKTGTPASFHIEAEGSGTVTYQWQYRMTGTTSWKTPSQTSAKTADYVFTLKPSYDNIEVRCIVSDDSGNEVISDTRKANVFAFTSQPKDAIASAGEVVNFEVSSIGNNVTYQWYYKRPNSTWKKTTVAGATTAVLPITAGTKNDGTSYRCVITDEAGNKINSTAALLTLDNISLQVTGISEDAYDVNGKSVTFHVDAVGNGNLTYQWQYKLAGETKWRTPSQASAKTADYVFKLKPSYDNIEVRCIVKDATGNSVTSDVRKANVFAITGQPQDAELELGEQTTFSVEAAGKDLAYQWFYMRPEGSWKKVTVAGANTANLVITANTKNDGTMFRCLVKDVLGNTLTSRAATLTQ